MRIIKKKALDDLSKKIDKAEEHVKEIKETNLNKEENEKLQRFELCRVIKMEKYLRQGGDPTFGNLDASEQTSEEFEYYLSHMLNDYTQEKRYQLRKEAYYFHPSYTEMEKLDLWQDRSKCKFCTGEKCVESCPYSNDNGRIEDEQVISEYINGTEILEIEDYKEQLGELLVNSILSEFKCGLSSV